VIGIAVIAAGAALYFLSRVISKKKEAPPGDR
jgi:hypothetical protein